MCIIRANVILPTILLHSSVERMYWQQRPGNKAWFHMPGKSQTIRDFAVFPTVSDFADSRKNESPFIWDDQAQIGKIWSVSISPTRPRFVRCSAIFPTYSLVFECRENPRQSGILQFPDRPRLMKTRNRRHHRSSGMVGDKSG